MLSKLLGRERSTNTLIQFIRYFFVGGAAFGVDYLALFLLAHFVGLHYLLAASLSYLMGMLPLVSIASIVVRLTSSLASAGVAEAFTLAPSMIVLFNFGARKLLLFT